MWWVFFSGDHEYTLYLIGCRALKLASVHRFVSKHDGHIWGDGSVEPACTNELAGRLGSRAQGAQA